MREGLYERIGGSGENLGGRDVLRGGEQNKTRDGAWHLGLGTIKAHGVRGLSVQRLCNFIQLHGYHTAEMLW